MFTIAQHDFGQQCPGWNVLFTPWCRTCRVYSERVGAPESCVSTRSLVSYVQDVVNTHPGLAFLREAAEFHSRYITTVSIRAPQPALHPWRAGSEGSVPGLEPSELSERGSAHRQQPADPAGSPRQGGALRLPRVLPCPRPPPLGSVQAQAPQTCTRICMRPWHTCSLIQLQL